MEIYFDDVSGVLVVTVAGELDGHTAPVAQDQILPMIQNGIRVVLNMTDLSYMSSAGARTLLLLYRQINQAQGAVILAGMVAEIQDMLGATGFLDYFQLAATVDDALAMFAG
jgi:anti-sigma B factor antagonist